MCRIGPKTGTQSTGTEQKPKITLQAGGQLTRRKGAKNTHQGKGSLLNKPCHTPKNTVLRLHHRQKASFPPQALSLLGPLKADTLGSQSHTRTFLPTFPHLFLPLPPGRSRGDRAPVHVNWTPQATKAESPVGPEESRLPPVWTHPRAVLKPRLSVSKDSDPSVPQAEAPAGPEEMGIPSAEGRATPVGTVHFPTPVQGGELCLP